MGWAKDHIAALAVFQLEEHIAHSFSTGWATIGRALVPQVLGLNNRHAHFLTTGAVHFFAHNL